MRGAPVLAKRWLWLPLTVAALFSIAALHDTLKRKFSQVGEARTVEFHRFVFAEELDRNAVVKLAAAERAILSAPDETYDESERTKPEERKGNAGSDTSVEYTKLEEQDDIELSTRYKPVKVHVGDSKQNYSPGGDVNAYAQKSTNDSKIVSSQNFNQQRGQTVVKPITKDTHKLTNQSTGNVSNVTNKQAARDIPKRANRTEEDTKMTNRAGENTKMTNRVEENTKRTNRTEENTEFLAQQKREECIQRKRQEKIEEVCDYYRKAGKDYTQVDKLKNLHSYHMLLVDDLHKIIYCEVPKAACTSWKVLFANISEKVPRSSPLYPKLYALVHDTRYHNQIGIRYMDTYSPEERLYRLQYYKKFMVTRNPFSRIVAAYRNKLQETSPMSWWYHDNVGKYLIKKYRENATAESLAKGKDVKFSELIQFIGNPEENSKHRYDPHWWTLQSICFPCLIKYDYVVKVENVHQEAPFLFHTLFPGMNLNLPKLNSHSQTSDNEVRDKYFANISRSDLDKLENVYSADMEMFGYSVKGTQADPPEC